MTGGVWCGMEYALTDMCSLWVMGVNGAVSVKIHAFTAVETD